MTVDGVYAVLLVSDDAPALATFYREAVGLPLEDEVHPGVPPHFGCDIGGVHLAIHPSDGWPGRAHPDGQAPVLVLRTPDVVAAYERLVAQGVAAVPPFDHGFAVGTAFRDPDGNNVQLMTPSDASVPMAGDADADTPSA